MDLLYQMLRETHLLPRRLTVLTRNDGQLLLALATAVVDLLPKHKSLHFQVQWNTQNTILETNLLLYENTQTFMFG